MPKLTMLAIHHKRTEPDYIKAKLLRMTFVHKYIFSGNIPRIQKNITGT